MFLKVTLNLLKDLLTLCICAQSFSISEIKCVARFQDLAKQNKVKSLPTLLKQMKPTSQLNNLPTGYQKQSLLKQHLLLKTSYFYDYTWLESMILVANYVETHI